MRKSTRLIALVAAIAAMSCMLFTACGGPKTLEEYVNSNTDAKKMIDLFGSDDGTVNIEIKDNDIIYTYDISGFDSVTKEMAKDKTFLKTFEKTFDASSSTFADMAKTMEKKSKISGIKIVVQVVYGDDEILSKTYSAKEE